jgi:hypothetical protein
MQYNTDRTMQYNADSARELQGSNDIGLGVNNYSMNNLQNSNTRQSFFAACCKKVLCCFRTTRVQKGALNQGEDIHQGDGDATFFGNGSQSAAVQEASQIHDEDRSQNNLVKEGFKQEGFDYNQNIAMSELNIYESLYSPYDGSINNSAEAKQGSPFKNEYLQQNGLKSKAQKINTRNQELKSEKKIENSHIGPSGVDVEVVSNAGNEGFKSSHSSSLNSSVCSSVHSNKAQWICKKHGNPESSNPNESFDSNKAQHSKCTKELKQGYPKINILPPPEFKQKKKESNANNVESNNFLSVPNGLSNQIDSNSPRRWEVKKR